MYHYHNLNVLSTGQSMWQDHRSFVIAIYILTTSIVKELLQVLKVHMVEHYPFAKTQTHPQ